MSQAIADSGRVSPSPVAAGMPLSSGMTEGASPGSAGEMPERADADNRNMSRGDAGNKPPLESTEAIVAALEEAAGIGKKQGRSGPDGRDRRDRPDRPGNDADAAAPGLREPEAAAQNGEEAAEVQGADEEYSPDSSSDAPLDSLRDIPSDMSPESTPASWDANTKALMRALSPELQQRFADREVRWIQSSQAMEQETQQARAQHDNLLQWATSNLDTAIDAACMAIDADFNTLDWQGIQKNDPEQYMFLEAMHQERLNGLRQSIVHLQALRGHQEQQQQEHRRRHVQKEFAAVAPTVRQLMGRDPSTPGLKNEIVEYLQGAGAPAEHINGLDHGYQLGHALRQNGAGQGQSREKSGRSPGRANREGPSPPKRQRRRSPQMERRPGKRPVQQRCPRPPVNVLITDNQQFFTVFSRRIPPSPPIRAPAMPAPPQSWPPPAPLPCPEGLPARPPPLTGQRTSPSPSLVWI